MGKFGSVKEYLSSLSPEQRRTLAPVRKLIMEVAPKSRETIAYQMLGYRENGIIVCLGAFSDHCSFFPCSARVLSRFKGQLRGFEMSRGTVRFTSKKKIPVALLRKIIVERLREKRAKKK
ncbi:MAG: DUF1801 domain-containing protein [Candidatus Micrarchaeota archaeon]|nr:DUF1801 domain-containing protein [Candidatus Micrarchaeota archaeon]